MGGNDEKGMTLCLLICNITSTPPMNSHLVPENHRAYYYRARSLLSLSLLQIPLTETWQWSSEIWHAHESPASWVFSQNVTLHWKLWEWMNEKICSCATCIACRQQVSWGTADLQDSNCEAKTKSALQINFFAPEGVCSCSALWTDVATYQCTEGRHRSYMKNTDSHLA